MPDFAALVTPPLLLDSTGAPANGDIYAKTTRSIVTGSGIATPTQVQGKVIKGEFKALNLTPFELPVTPDGVGIELFVELLEVRPHGTGSTRDRHQIRRTVSVPNQATVTWVELVDLVAVEAGPDVVVPTWVADAFAAKDVAVEAATTAENAKTTAQSAASTATTAAAAAQAIGTTNDTVMAAVAANPTSAFAAQQTGSFVGIPVAAEKTVFVSPRGNDSNNGLTLKAAFLTLNAALAALGGTAGTIQLGAGTTTTNATHTLPSGTVIRGTGRQLGASMINYTGTGTLFQGTSGTRTYNHVFENILFNGPGKASTAVAIDLVDISQAKIAGCTFGTFGTAIRHRSVVLGGAVYNTVMDTLINSCTTGVKFEMNGSNGSRWWGVKFGACTVAVDIMDSNQNNFLACQFEANTTAFKIDATLAGLSDHNSITNTRFESNTTSINIVSNLVRDTEITWPAIFGTWTVTDNGARTKWLVSGALASPPGSQRNLITRAGSYALTMGDDVVLFNVGTAQTATLPDPAVAGSGRQFVLRNIGAGTITVGTTAGTIDGTVALTTGTTGRWISNGTNWYAI